MYVGVTAEIGSMYVHVTVYLHSSEKKQEKAFAVHRLDKGPDSCVLKKHFFYLLCTCVVKRIFLFVKNANV
jgi:hypothetical protein